MDFKMYKLQGRASPPAIDASEGGGVAGGELAIWEAVPPKAGEVGSVLFWKPRI